MLRWGDQEHGHLNLYCEVELDQLQRQALVDSVASQLGHALEARELELQLLQSSRLVSLGEMAAGVAHELNQPLAAVSAIAEGIILRRDAGITLPAERLHQMMEHVLQMVERMNEIIQQLRVFARDTGVERGVPFSLNQTVGDSLIMIQAQLRNRGIEVRLELQEDLPSVEGHSHQLGQVLVNLLANARDAFGEGEYGLEEPDKVIQICTRSMPGAMPQVLLEVEDNGSGVSDSVKERIFEPFFTTKEADRGTGLGLSISYAIVRNHGGRLQCRSLPGEGATFGVLLPAHIEGLESGREKK
jgi:C4-dicarboxylate-specific signal transduction histidine kinase